MERLTHERVNGIKTGYWSAATKEVLVVAEMVPQVPGQMNMDGTQQEAPKLLKLVQHA